MKDNNPLKTIHSTVTYKGYKIVKFTGSPLYYIFQGEECVGSGSSLKKAKEVCDIPDEVE